MAIEHSLNQMKHTLTGTNSRGDCSSRPDYGHSQLEPLAQLDQKLHSELMLYKEKPLVKQ
jgi:hypothetical protein